MKSKPSALSYVAMILMLLMLGACSGSDDDDDDTTPDAFSFEDEDDVALGDTIVSEGVEIEGINTETEISIEGGEYSINGGDFTDEDGEVTNGDIIFVQVEASDEIDTEVEATVTVGGVEDTFTVTTEDVSLVIQDAFKALSFDWVAAEGADFYQLFYKPDADSDFEQVGRDIEAGSTGFDMEIPIHLTDWFNAEYFLQACTEAVCSATDEVAIFDYMVRSIAYFKAPNPEEFDTYGVVEISADGNTLVIGAPGEDGGNSTDLGNNAVSGAGAVYVYTKEDDVWNYLSYVKAPVIEASDGFGSALAISSDGTTLAVGAPFEDSSATGIDGDTTDNTLADSGAVYVYQRIGSDWILQNYIKASNPSAGDEFGSNLAISTFGATLVVGVPNEDGTEADPTLDTVEDSGAAYVFTLASDNWAQTAYLKAPNAEAGDEFGSSISISANGNLLAAGAPHEASSATGIDGDQTANDAADSGAVYTYMLDGAGWTFSNYLKASNALAEQAFGTALALSPDGDRLLVGAPFEASDAIGVNGDESDQSIPGSGAAYLFNLEGNVTQEAYIKSSNGDESDNFGSSVSISLDGSIIAIGAPGESSSSEGVSGLEADNTETDSGAVYVFVDNGTEYEQEKYVKAPNTDAGDGFGTFLSLSGDGETLAIGAPNEASSSELFTNIQSSNATNEAGAVYLY